MPRSGRIALALSFALTIISAIYLGGWLAGQVAYFQHVALDHDEGAHAAPAVVIAADLRSGELRGFLRDTVAQSFYPFVFSWLAAPFVMAFGASALVLRTLNAGLLLLAAVMGWAIAAELAPAHRWLAGLVAAGLMLTSAPLLVNSAHIYLDPAGLVFTLLTLFVYTRTLPIGRRPEGDFRTPASPSASDALRFTHYVFRFTPFFTGLLLALTFLVKYPFGPFLIGGIGLSELLRNREVGRWRPTREQWIMAGTAAGVVALWALLPGVLRGMRDYAGAHPTDVPLFSFENWLYYPRMLVTAYVVSPAAGWLVLLATVFAAVQRADKRLRAWALYVWASILVLILRRALEPRFAHTVLPAAFVVAGVMASRVVGVVAQALRPGQPGEKAERTINISLGALLQADVEIKVRRVWAENTLGRSAAVALLVLAAGGVLAESGRAWSRRQAIYPILLPLTYKTDALAITGEPAVNEGAPALYDYIAEHVQAPTRLALFYGWLELSEPALRWELLRRSWPAGRPLLVDTIGLYRSGASPENIQRVHDTLAAFHPEYVVVYSDARYGGAHAEFNPFAHAMRDDLQLVASAVYTPTVIENFKLIEQLLENRPMAADELNGRLQGFTKPWPHYVDIYRYQAGAFAGDPLPDLTGLLDTPNESRNFALPQPQVPVGANFGGQVTLLGYDLERVGATATFTFYWRAKRWMPEAYHVFVHVAQAAGEPPLAGQDIEPRDNGSYPMTWWAPGEVVSDKLTVDLSALPPGKYVVGTGIYDFNSGARLAATDASGVAYDDGWLPLIEGVNVP